MKTLDTYRKFRKTNVAKSALNNAKTLQQWEALESAGLVRLRAEPEQDNYFDVYGNPDSEKERKQICEVIDRMGCWCVLSEYWDGKDWQHADSIGMCVYDDPTSPFENDYVPNLMRVAIDLVPQVGEH